GKRDRPKGGLVNRRANRLTQPAHSLPARSLTISTSIQKGFLMTQAQVERAVCQASGESRELIQRMGFSLIWPPTNRQARLKIRRSTVRTRLVAAELGQWAILTHRQDYLCINNLGPNPLTIRSLSQGRRSGRLRIAACFVGRI